MTTWYHELDETGAKVAGNWKRFESFGWHDRPEDADRLAIIYLSNRDSDALDRSNERIILRELASWMGEDCWTERHGHWAVGHVNALVIRTGTAAYARLYELACELADYLVLDDEDFAREEQEEADQTWRVCYTDRQRLDYIRDNRSEFEFSCMADLMACVRGKFFAGRASELLG